MAAEVFWRWFSFAGKDAVRHVKRGFYKIIHFVFPNRRLTDKKKVDSDSLINVEAVAGHYGSEICGKGDP